jgi:hypothetical protein
MPCHTPSCSHNSCTMRSRWAAQACLSRKERGESRADVRAGGRMERSSASASSRRGGRETGRPASAVTVVNSCACCCGDARAASSGEVANESLQRGEECCCWCFCCGGCCCSEICCGGVWCAGFGSCTYASNAPSTFGEKGSTAAFRTAGDGRSLLPGDPE